MARNKFPVEVLTPEGKVFGDEVEMVSTRTGVGSIGILANHAPLMAMLEPTELRLYRSDNEIVRFAQGEGYIQVGGNRALVLVEDAIDPRELDVADLREKLTRAESAVAGAEPHSEAQRRALRDKRRWETFLLVAEGSAGP